MKRKKIAIIDDNKDIISTVKYGIEDEDNSFEIFGFDKPENFSHETKNTKFDLILLDIMMPKINGWDLFSLIKNEDNKNKKTPILFLTAKTDDQSVVLGKFTSEDYITKPFEIKDLIKRINKHLK